VFEQGNKRIGLASAIIFLAVNGHRVEASNEALTDLVMSMASVGDARESVEAFFDANIETCQPMSYEDASAWMHAAFAATFIELAK
jgi:prophage maintenance system killer protein